MANDSRTQTTFQRRFFIKTAAGLVITAGIAPLLYAGYKQVFASSSAKNAPHVSHQLLLGHDLSMLQQLERAGRTFSDQGRVQLAERILAKHGAKYVRLRLWVNPPIPYNDLPHILLMAKRIKAAGLKLLLDLHYSDFWADPGKQLTPKSWQGQSLTPLSKTVHNYTRNVVEQLNKQHTPIDIIQIGNEITTGMLWPQGEIYVNGTQRWSEFTTLLKAGISGAHDAGSGEKPRIMIHIDRGGDNSGSRYFYDHILQFKVPFDIIGLSYYPWLHGPLAHLQANLNDLATRYHKDLVIVETAYPWTLTNGNSKPNQSNAQIALLPGYAPTPDGQLAYIRQLISILKQVPEQRGQGLVYWEPDWIPGAGWEPGAGDPVSNMTLFDYNGRALSSIKCFERA